MIIGKDLRIPDDIPFEPVKRFGVKRIICVGDSITYGYLSSNREENAWPVQL